MTGSRGLMLQQQQMTWPSASAITGCRGNDQQRHLPTPSDTNTAYGDPSKCRRPIRKRGQEKPTTSPCTSDAYWSFFSPPGRYGLFFLHGVRQNEKL